MRCVTDRAWRREMAGRSLASGASHGGTCRQTRRLAAVIPETCSTGHTCRRSDSSSLGATPPATEDSYDQTSADRVGPSLRRRPCRTRCRARADLQGREVRHQRRGRHRLRGRRAGHGPRVRVALDAHDGGRRRDRQSARRHPEHARRARRRHRDRRPATASRPTAAIRPSRCSI